ncbi:hypothetical protein C7I85_25350 [Mesorhizobium soli]|uniref:Uncharacterized protein n=1 Tax=Pseudaminobacter soli (ex Li et al. 2025) TaxID=1295366 RepID=A0A2P7S0S1_9HYPH|nr:hypothetical protein C7I85_25350 [Mesorhizobium soli]
MQLLTAVMGVLSRVVQHWFRGGRMSSDGHHEYFAPSDMAMIERVLARFDLREPLCSPAMQRGAAKFLIRKFQEGMTEEVDMAIALVRYLGLWRVWWSRPQPSAEPLPNGVRRA